MKVRGFSQRTLQYLAVAVLALSMFMAPTVYAENIITTIAGTYDEYGYSGDGGPAKLAKFDGASDVAVDKFGNVYICGSWNNSIRKVDKAGVISTVAGTGMDWWNQESSGDGGPATEAKLCGPASIAADSNGNLFIADEDQSIRKVDTDGIITTVAGTHDVEGYSGDGGAATSALLGYFNTVGGGFT